MPLFDRLFGDDDDRVDGRDLPELIEPGSDDLLLRGLLLRFRRVARAMSDPPDDEEP